MTAYRFLCLKMSVIGFQRFPDKGRMTLFVNLKNTLHQRCHFHQVFAGAALHFDRQWFEDKI